MSLSRTTNLLNVFNTVVVERVRNIALDSLREACSEYMDYLSNQLPELFRQDVYNFYNDYPNPTYYKRTYSLYNILNVDRTSNYEISYGFAPERMSGFRNGYKGEDGLYDQVFRRGWHGGSDHISPEKVHKWGSHPNPGTPYWRTPRCISKRYNKEFYPLWGDEAKVADESPYQAFTRQIAELTAINGGKMIQELYVANLAEKIHKL